MAQWNRSIEERAQEILRSILSEEPMPTGNLADRIRRRVEPLGGIELELPPRGSIRKPPDFQ
jgi:plasmid stability protein